jgi:hypothetical protein
MQSQVNSSTENAPVMVKKANEVHDFKYKMKRISLSSTWCEFAQ